MLIALGVAVIAALEVSFNEQIQPKPAVLACELAMAATLAWRREAPLTAVTVGAGLQPLMAATGVPLGAPAVPLVVGVFLTYTVVSYIPLRRALIATGILLAGFVAMVLVGHQTLGNLMFALFFLGGGWALGRVVRLRTAQAVQAELRVQELARERAESARRVAAEERAHIARELHDVVAHSVSVMVVQAGGAEQVLATDPARAVEAMRAVQTTGRQTIGELGSLLGVLRDQVDEPRLAPQPTLADLPSLLDEATANGLHVDLRVEGTATPLQPGVELAVYRIVQEALTNTRKHGGASADASVLLRYEDGSVVAEVIDTGLPPVNGYGGGHGLVGMRERVALYGGTLRARARDGGQGFVVTARIPLRGQE